MGEGLEVAYARSMASLPARRPAPFIKNVLVVPERIERPDEYPFTIPAVKGLDGLTLGAVTYFVGENGSGKSTILEAIAVAAGFNAEGGTANFQFATRRSESPLHRCLRLARIAKPKAGFFLRAESFFNVATQVEELGVQGYGDVPLHEQSHGESFLALIQHRFGPKGLYILDEPEAALSASRQLALLVRMRDLLREGSQFIIATHAPIVLSYPGAIIYGLDEEGISEVPYDQVENVALTRTFLADRERYLERLFSNDE